MTFGLFLISFAKLQVMGDCMKLNVKDYNKGEIMKIVRQWTGLTQREFSSKMNKSKRTIEQYEAGTVNYNIDFLMNLCKTFDIEITIRKT